jgi:hypothetical protein
MIKTTAAMGGYEMGGNKTSCRSDDRKHDEKGGRGQVEKKRVEGGIVSVRLRYVRKVDKRTTLAGHLTTIADTGTALTKRR